jgi:hypothetical protein
MNLSIENALGEHNTPYANVIGATVHIALLLHDICKFAIVSYKSMNAVLKIK